MATSRKSSVGRRDGRDAKPQDWNDSRVFGRLPSTALLTCFSIVTLGSWTSGYADDPGEVRREFPSRQAPDVITGNSIGDGGERHPIPKYDKPQSRNRDTKTSKLSSVGSLSSTLIALSVVALLIICGAQLLKRHRPRFLTGLPTEAVELLGKRHLDQRQAIHLVRCGSKILVLGSSPNGLVALSEVTDPVEVDSLSGLCRRQEEDRDFSSSLTAWFQRREKQEPHRTVNQQAARSTPLSSSLRIDSPGPLWNGESLPSAAATVEDAHV